MHLTSHKSMSLEVSAIVVANKSVPFTYNKAGEGMVVVSQKRLGEITGLKGAALKKAHFAYRLDAGKALNAGLSAGMAAGEIVAKSVVPTKTGGLRAVFDRVSAITAPAEKPVKVQALEAEIAALKAQLAAANGAMDELAANCA